MKGFRWIVRTAALLAAVMVFTACSSGNSGGTGATSPASGQSKAVAAGGGSAEEYVDGLCTALGDWLAAIQEQSQNIPTSFTSAKEGKTELVKFLDALIASTDQATASLEAMGAPDVDGGAETHQALIEAFNGVADLFTQARDQINGLSTKDAAAFGAQVQAIGTSMQSATSAIDAAMSGINSQELDAAYAQSTACTNLGASIPSVPAD